MIIFAVEAPDDQNTIGAPDDQNTVEQDYETTTNIGFAVGVPLAGLFTTIALGYSIKDSPSIQGRTGPKYWLF